MTEHAQILCALAIGAAGVGICYYAHWRELISQIRSLKDRIAHESKAFAGESIVAISALNQLRLAEREIAALKSRLEPFERVRGERGRFVKRDAADTDAA